MAGHQTELPSPWLKKGLPSLFSAVSAVSSLESRTFSNGRETQNPGPSHFPVTALGEAIRPTRRAKAGANGGRVEEPVGNVTLDSWQETQ